MRALTVYAVEAFYCGEVLRVSIYDESVFLLALFINLKYLR